MKDSLKKVYNDSYKLIGVIILIIFLIIVIVMVIEILRPILMI